MHFPLKHFMIQTGTNGQIVHDFSFRLLEAVRYADWKYGQPQYGYSFAEKETAVEVLLKQGVSPIDIVPIGSIEFVFGCMKLLRYNVDKVIPLNVPFLLNKVEFLNRTYHTGLTRKDLMGGGFTFPQFIKSANVYKGFVDIVETKSDLDRLSSNEKFTVSEVVDIEEEWRVFVQQDEIIGAKPYGSRTLFPKAPNLRFLKRMTHTIEKARNEGELFPLSYTLDVGVSMDGSFLIECHPFVSCGLYGFDELERLPSMLIQGYAYFQKQCENKGG